MQSRQVFFACRDEGEESGVGDLREPQEKYGTDAKNHGDGNLLFQHIASQDWREASSKKALSLGNVCRLRRIVRDDFIYSI